MARAIDSVGRRTIYLVDEDIIVYGAGMAIDFDGAPDAYAPRGSGLVALDDLANAGGPRNWCGVVTDDDLPTGEPVVQGESDPCPGYYVSATALGDRARPRRDPRRYVDATQVPYISIPSPLLHLDGKHGVHKGDVGIALNLRNGASCSGLVADVGPAHRIGEASPAMARAIGFDASRRGGASEGVLYAIWQGSTKGWPRSNEDIALQVAELLAHAGGLERISREVRTPC